MDSSLKLAGGITVTIEPGVLLKFGKSASIEIEDGGTLVALGTASNPIIMTSIADDSVGGDTNLDNDQTIPLPGDWHGVTRIGSANFTTNEWVSIRYAMQIHGGTLVQSETWDGTFLHRIASDFTVPSGLALNIEAGAIIKIDLNQSIKVNAGGALTAEGTSAQPIVFTSIKDDSVGGDSNQDGNSTLPAPGD